MGPVGADLLKTLHTVKDAVPINIPHELLNVLIVSITVSKFNTLTQEIVSIFSESNDRISGIYYG